MGRPTAGWTCAALAVACVLLSLRTAAAGPCGAHAPVQPGRRLLQQDFWWTGLDSDTASTTSSWWQELVNRVMGNPKLLDSQASTARDLTPEKPAGSPQFTPAPLSASDAAAAEKVRADSSVPMESRPCGPDGDGGLNCGIPIGYKGTNRTGTYYLPKTYKDKPLPLMILLHGSGVDGNWMLQDLPFEEFADKHQIIVLAPDSKDDMYWIIPDTAEEAFTADLFHIEACYEWFIKDNPQGARVDTQMVSIVGNSRAGYVAPPFCSRSTVVPCSAAVIMHASALPDQMGPKVIPILWTAGVNDDLYGPEATAINKNYFGKQAPQFPIYYNEWDSGHSLNKSQELDYICAWVANVSFRSTPAPPVGSYRRRLAAAPCM